MSHQKHTKAGRLNLTTRLVKYRVTSEATTEAVFDLLCGLDCPRSLAVWLMFSNNEHDQLRAIEFNPAHYGNASELADAYKATEFLSKFADLSANVDLDEVAFTKFSKFEDLCKHTNSRFRNLGADPLFHGSAVRLHNAVVRKISRVLGDFSAEELFDSANWGPGSTPRIKRGEASAANKFQCEIGITREAYALLFPRGDWKLFEDAYPHWASHLRTNGFPSFELGNKVTTVPKNSSTNRVIAIEPGINLWFQKAIGEMIRRRLLSVGIDLNSQTRNQQLARRGSLDPRIATVDFSSASDSIALKVVEECLPPRWFALLDTFRSHYGRKASTFTRWEKFSSMGNGFTFELESLLFYCIASCCKEELGIQDLPVSVYGDDVIIPTDAFPLFETMCTFYGFLINRRKTCLTSNFRESCGSHYVSGIDVKPYYLKGNITSIPSLFKAANGIRRLSHRSGFLHYCDKRFERCYRNLVSKIPKALRLLGPEGYGDGYLIENFDLACPTRAPHWIEGYNVKHLQELSITSDVDYTGLFLARLWVPSVLMLRNSVAVRDRTRHAVKRILVRQWYDLGPWL